MNTDQGELILEILRKMQSDISAMRGDLDALSSDVRGIKAHMAGFMQTEIAQDGALAELRHRVDRIERRLEIQD
ncbi:MAG: hypothetical protein NXI16_04690 [Alphaproteobacteria bacterium]|nr:hypothetical protein [Alphaproteobacteria bacterium]